MAVETVFLSTGSNCGMSIEMLAKARLCIADIYGCTLVAASRIYRTEPQGFTHQPWFSNQVLRLDVAGWEPSAFLECLLTLERRLGRERREAIRFGPRSIDIDLLLYGQRVSQNPLCILPHPRMWQRAFVLKPLCDLTQDLPDIGRQASDCLSTLDWSQQEDRIYQK